MFSKLSVFVASVLLTLAAAMPAPNDTPPVTTPTSPQCCTSVVSSSSTAAGAVAAPLGLDLTGLDVPVGLSCTPITVAGDNCGSTTVTCDTPDPAWGGLIAINCIPITA
ncbi:hydrophobin 2 [Mycena leptocephala]|nr:hydrophobin 2 [Mycena leptocephala]